MSSTNPIHAGWHKSCRVQGQRSGRTFRWHQWSMSADAPSPSINSDQHREEIRKEIRQENREVYRKEKGDTQKIMRKTSISLQYSEYCAREHGYLQIHNKEDSDGNPCQFLRRQEPLTIRLAVTFVHDWRGLTGLIDWSLQASLSHLKSYKMKSVARDSWALLFRCCFVSLPFKHPLPKT